jgi:hypothetical protein
MIVLQNSFIDGMDLISPDMQMAENSYRWLMNGRQRYGEIQANNSATKVTGAPAGTKQGIIAVGNVLVLFVNGEAYWNVDGSSTWTKIANFKMDTSAMYYAQAIPGSTFNFTRKLATTANIKDPLNVSVDLSIIGTPSGILVQDGIHQPWVIFYDYTNKTFIARVTKGYSSWTQSNPEYVPIGKKMMVVDSILFIEAIDGQSIYRSVSGMPLNFMLNVDFNGDKQTTEAQGGADTTSFAFDFDKVTNITPSSTPSSFICATARTLRIISLDYNDTIFGEPTFSVAAVIDAGVSNQYSLVEINGDIAFVDYDGVKTFNAVLQLKYKGQNSNFSVPIMKLLKYANGKSIKQTEAIAFNFNNYSIFALQSIWGFLYFVYDTISNKWVALDSTFAGKITRVAITETTTESKLYAINNANELWWLYSNTAKRETAVLVTRPYSSKLDSNYYEDNLKVQHKSEQLKLAIKNGVNAGTISATEYVDEQLSSVKLDLPLNSMISGINYPVQVPVVPNNAKLKEHKTFVWRDGLQGRKLGYIIKWDNDATLSEIQLTTVENNPDSSAPQSQQSVTSTYGS